MLLLYHQKLRVYLQRRNNLSTGKSWYHSRDGGEIMSAFFSLVLLLVLAVAGAPVARAETGMANPVSWVESRTGVALADVYTSVIAPGPEATLHLLKYANARGSWQARDSYARALRAVVKKCPGAPLSVRASCTADQQEFSAMIQLLDSFKNKGASTLPQAQGIRIATAIFAVHFELELLPLLAQNLRASCASNGKLSEACRKRVLEVGGLHEFARDAANLARARAAPTSETGTAGYRTLAGTLEREFTELGGVVK